LICSKRTWHLSLGVPVKPTADDRSPEEAFDEVKLLYLNALLVCYLKCAQGKVTAPSRLLFLCNLSSYSPMSALRNKIFSLLEVIHASVWAEGRYLTDFSLFFILNGSLSNHWSLLDWIDKSWSRLIEGSFSLFFFLKWIFHHRAFKEMRKKRRILVWGKNWRPKKSCQTLVE